MAKVRILKISHFFLALTIFLFGTSLFAQEKEKVDIQSGYLERREEFPDAAIYTRDEAGQVYIVHEGIEMWCDQAFVYIKNNFVKAYGDVRLSQGDTISLHSKYAEYNGNTQFAFASGNVILTEPKTTLQTDSLYFDRIKQQAYYRTGGTVKDTASVLTSKSGRYFAESKKYQFLSDVKIVNPKYTVNSSQLDFFSESGAAYLYGPSTITSETSIVYCERGYYDTRGDTGYFVKNSKIDYENRTLYGDSIFFDRNKGFASATNNIKVLDTINKSLLRAHYAEVFREKDSVIATKRAVAMTVQDNDTIYVHADTLQITGKTDNRILKGFYRARMFKPGKLGEEPMSGKCDSIYVNEKTGITKLLRNPVLWSGDNQMTGDTIHLLSNTATEQLDTLKVFNNAFIIQKDSIGFNQVKGQQLIGLFTDNQLDTVNINKNTQVIYYARNDNGELIGIDNTVSSSLQMYLKNQQIVGIRFIKKVPGKLYPPSMLPKNARLLPGFNWRGEERLYSVEDLFIGKEKPILPKITGIPLPNNEGEFFEDSPEFELPKESKLSPRDLQNRDGDPKPISAESETTQKATEQKVNDSLPTNDNKQ